MRILIFSLIIALIFFVSCSVADIDETVNEVEKEPVPSNEDETEKTDVTPENAVVPEQPENTETDVETENGTSETKPDVEEKKEPIKDEFTPIFEYELIKSENPLLLKLKTQNAYIEISFSKDKTILDFFSDELQETGKKHLIKKCIDYVETFFSRIQDWLSSADSEPEYSGICLMLHECANNADAPVMQIPSECDEYVRIVMNLNEFNRENINRRLWFELIPINSEIIRTGLSYVQPNIKRLSTVEYYKFISVTRMSVTNKDFFKSTSPYNEFYNLQRADFVSFMLENSESAKEFLKNSEDETKFRELYTSWIINRRQFFEKDKLPEHFKLLYQCEKGQYKTALRNLSNLNLEMLKTEEGQFLDFVNLCFFANKFDYIQKYMEEQVLSKDFLLRRFPKTKKSILYHQLRMPIELLCMGIVKRNTEFNKNLVIYLEKLGFVLLSKFLLYSENVLHEIELIRESGKKELQQFLDIIPMCYKRDFQWWYHYICMISELKFGFVSTARNHLQELSRISTSNEYVQFAEYSFELY